MYLEIITPDKRVFEGEVSSAQLPGTQGSFEVLNNHAPLISTLENGRIRVTSAAGNLYFNVNGGVVEVLKNKIIVLAEGITE